MGASVTNQFRAGPYLVTSYGNGWAYEVQDTRDGACIWMQDDEAALLRDETNGFEDLGRIEDYMILLSE